jgi:hypothetical protein
MHGRLIPTSRGQEGHLPPECLKPFEIQPARCLVDLIADHCDRHIDSRACLLAKHLEDIAVSEPGYGYRDIGLSPSQMTDDYLVNIREISLEFHFDALLKAVSVYGTGIRTL